MIRYILIIFNVCFFFLFMFFPKNEIKIQPKPLPIIPRSDIPSPIVPNWKNYPPLRHVTNLGIVLSDIESHMPANHIYRDSDKITWAHESTHGLASYIRQKYSTAGYVALIGDKEVFKSADRINGFYVLNDRAVTLHEPQGTLTDVANAVPRELRGDVYNLYLKKAASSWNNEPLYLLDEFVAYTNGSATRADLKIAGRAETVRYMMEFALYAICVLKATKCDDDVKIFTKWQLERAMEVWKANGVEAPYWDKAKQSKEIKDFCFSTFGIEWSKRVLDFNHP
jgi:hypothetical protein